MVIPDSLRLPTICLLVIVSAGTPQTGNGWIVRPDGVGAVKIGMTLAQLNRVMHERFATPESKDEQACFYVGSAKHPHTSFMIVEGRLARIDVRSAGIPTTEGIQVGDSEKRARQVYGSRLRVQPHAYAGPEGHYLTVRSSDGRYGIRFETGKGKITMFYAGRFDALQYIEGCQ